MKIIKLSQNKNINKKEYPDWLNINEIVKSSNINYKAGLTKVSNIMEYVVKDFYCDNCKKTYLSDSDIIQTQLTMQKISSSPLVCPKCGEKLIENSYVPVINNDKAIVSSRYFRGNSTPFSIAHRLVVFRAIDSLSKYAKEMGFNPNMVRYLRSGDLSSTYSKIFDFEIEVPVYENKSLRFYASMLLNHDGSFEYPKVFRTSDGKEYPFDKKFISEYLNNKISAYIKKDELYETLSERKSDKLHFRKKDHTIYSSINIDVGQKIKNPIDNKSYIIESYNAENGEIVAYDEVNKSNKQVFKIEKNNLNMVNKPTKSSVVEQALKEARKKLYSFFYKKGNPFIDTERVKYLDKISKFRNENNIPQSESGDVNIGMTEFPKGQKKLDSTGHPLSNNNGYRIPFKEMDENHVKTRERFDNEKRLPIYIMRRDELKHYLNSDEISILSSIINKYSQEDEESIVEKPIEFKELQKAPSGIDIPESIEQPDRKLEELIKKLEQESEKIKNINEEIEKIRTNYMQQMEKEIGKFEKRLEQKEKDFYLLMEMVYNQLLKIDSKITWYKDYLYFSRMTIKEVSKQATLKEVIDEAKQFYPEVAELINEIKQKIESRRIQKFIERILYKFPVGKAHKDKIKKGSFDFEDQDFEDIYNELYNWIQESEELLSKYK